MAVQMQTGARPNAGVRVPDSALITDAVEYARKVCEPYLFNHAMRSWLFAAKIGQTKGIDCDFEVVAVGTVLHDIGLSASVRGANRFEVNGADAARSFVKERGISDRRAQLIWDLVALNGMTVTKSVESDTGGGALLRLLAAAGKAWKPAELASITVADRENDMRRIDASAGCEFLDDWILSEE